VAKWRNPLADKKPTTVGLFLMTALWAGFQWKDPTPPPVLDQILVASFGAWFAAEAVDNNKKKKNDSDQKDDDEDTKGGT
jgi:hypothetical protein